MLNEIRAPYLLVDAVSRQIYKGGIRTFYARSGFFVLFNTSPCGIYNKTWCSLRTSSPMRVDTGAAKI